MKQNRIELDFHGHEQPLIAGNVNSFGPLIQGSKFKADPLETSHQGFSIVLRDQSVQADNNLRASERTFGEINEGDQSI